MIHVNQMMSPHPYMGDFCSNQNIVLVTGIHPDELTTLILESRQHYHHSVNQVKHVSETKHDLVYEGEKGIRRAIYCIPRSRRLYHRAWENDGWRRRILNGLFFFPLQQSFYTKRSHSLCNAPNSQRVNWACWCATVAVLLSPGTSLNSIEGHN